MDRNLVKFISKTPGLDAEYLRFTMDFASPIELKERTHFLTNSILHLPDLLAREKLSRPIKRQIRLTRNLQKFSKRLSKKINEICDKYSEELEMLFPYRQ